MTRFLIFFTLGLVVVSSLGLEASASSLGREPDFHSVLASLTKASMRLATGLSAPVDWPTYLYDPERTGANLLERTISPSNVSQLRELWSVSSNGSDFSAPIVVNGTVYFGSWNGYEYAVTAASGRVEWQTYLGINDCGNGVPQGITSTPTYLNGTLYLGGGGGMASGNDTYWYALNASSGNADWSYLEGNNTTNDFNWASALVYNNSLYIGIASCADNPLVPAGLREVNITGDHTARHVFNTTPPGDTGESIWSTPAVDPTSNVVWLDTGNEDPSEGYPLYANAVIAVNATTLAPLGSWQIPSTYQGQDSDFGATPTLFTASSGLAEVVVSNKDGYAYAFNRSNVSSEGSWGPIWSLSTGGGWGGAAFDGQTLYLAGRTTGTGAGELYAVNPTNGSFKWATTLPGGYIFGALTSADGIVYAGAGSDVYAVDAANGTILWNCTMPDGEVTVSEPVVDDGRLYVASGNYGELGNLTAFGIPLSLNASASALNGAAPLTLDFSAAAHGGMTPYSYEWHFGDGTTSNISSPSHTYSEGGNYTARGTVTDAASDSTNVTLLIDVIATYAVTFVATGLQPGTEWWVNLTDGQSFISTTTTLLFNEPNGTYFYSVATSDKTYFSPGESFTVKGTGASETCNFGLVTYTVTVTENGLPANATWWVNLTSGETFSTTTNTLSFPEPNGTYDGVVATSDKEYAPLSTSVLFEASGAPVIESVTFNPITYTVTFKETGSPDGTNWSVTLVGSSSAVILVTLFEEPAVTLTRWSDGASAIQFNVPNGSYSYSASVPGRPSSSGTLTVDGPAAGPILVSPESNPSPASSSPTFGYMPLGVVVTVVTIGAVLVVMRRRGKAHPTFVTTPSQAERGAPPARP